MEPEDNQYFYMTIQTSVTQGSLFSFNRSCLSTFYAYTAWIIQTPLTIYDNNILQTFIQTFLQTFL